MTKRSNFFIWGLCLALGLAACKPLNPVQESTPTHTRIRPTATQENRTPTATKIPEIIVDPQQLKGTQITFLHPWAAETGKLMDTMVNEFNQNNEWGINVVVEKPGSTGLVIQQLENTKDDNESVDLAAVPVYELLKLDQEQRKVVDLNPYVYSSKFGFSKEQVSDFDPAFWNENLLNGELLGIPAQETASVLFYNVTWAGELGFSSAPKSAAAFQLQTCAANSTFRKDDDRSNDGVGGWLISEDAGTLFSWLNVFNAVDLSQPVEKFASADTGKTFEYLFSLQKDACAWNSRLPEPYDYFANRQALVYSGTLQDVIPQTRAFTRNGLTDNWQMIPYPSTSEGGVITQNLSYGIFTSDETRQLAAWLFVRWLSQPEQQARLLQTSGSLPLGNSVIARMQEFEGQYPQWKTALETLTPYTPMPLQSNAGMVSVVLEDAGTFLFKPEFTADQIPTLMTDLDATLQELTNRQQ